VRHAVTTILDRLTRRLHIAPAALPGMLMMLVGPRVGDVLGFVYGLLLGRWLSGADFGRASAILNAISIPATALGVLICRETVWRSARNQHAALLRYVWHWFWWVLGLTGALAVVVVMFSSYVGTIFRYEYLSTTCALAAFVIVTGLSPLWGSVIQGQRRYLLLGSIPMVQGFSKLLLTAALLYTGWQLTGVLTAQVLSSVLVIVWILVVAQRPYAVTDAVVDDAQRVSDLRSLLNNLMTTGATVTLLSIDVVVVNFVFPGAMAGGYAAVSMFGKIALYLPETFAVYLQPVLMRARAAHGQNRYYFSISCLLGLGGTLMLAGVFWLGGAPLFAWLMPAYVAYAGYLPVYTLAMGLLAIARLAGTFAMARDDARAGLWLTGIAVLQLIGFFLFRQTLWHIVGVELVIAVLAAAAGIAATLWPHTASGSAVRPADRAA
jgi:O-antigen/teichoic acid export membrane protein